MSAGCVRWMLSRTVKAVCVGSHGYWTPASRFTIRSERSNLIASSWRGSPFCSAVDDTEKPPTPKKKKPGPRAHGTISSVGHDIPHREIQLISETGENLGTMHRGSVIRLMDKNGLKLVLLSEHQDPPVYRLMSGKQIHEEKLKQREKQKAKAPTQVKEISFLSCISSHDLSTKMNRVGSWLEKKNHVRITMKAGRRGPSDNLDITLEEIVEGMEKTVGYVSKPALIQDGQAAMCILRPPSAKDLLKKDKNKTAAEVVPPGDKSTTTIESVASVVSSTDTTEGSLQQ
ncbi:translation initiation factor IF-3, mitochondrial [Notothenia coriiceps]|uniref:Translation initiation factor IF-3, mitochondrial n=1 Tax=Notothenia coriiceps TaxID=8208 RepID=A0A6I9N0F0_9TELE|nr:PREDICTED: translation initiation factor IF-3, mitochondrial [Notothenia coriiceps]